jgi:hypothetical protein
MPALSKQVVWALTRGLHRALHQDAGPRTFSQTAGYSFRTRSVVREHGGHAGTVERSSLVT